MMRTALPVVVREMCLSDVGLPKKISPTVRLVREGPGLNWWEDARIGIANIALVYPSSLCSSAAPGLYRVVCPTILASVSFRLLIKLRVLGLLRKLLELSNSKTCGDIRHGIFRRTI